MTESPERIWAYAGAFRMWREKYPEHVKSPVEYLRADHVADMLKAEREKALREAAEKVADLYGEYSEGVPYCDRDEAVAVIEALISEDKTDG